MGVGLIGFGRLGRLLARHAAARTRIFVYDVELDARAVRALGAVPATLEQACAQPVVVLCVPIGEFEGLVRRVSGLLRPDALVVDTCSVKEHPVRVMKRLLPAGVSLLATHPIFGPDSAADSLRGRPIIVHPTRLAPSLYRRARRALAGAGLEVVEMTPREHDRRMAGSQLLTHFIGRALAAYGAKTTGVDTEGYKRLLYILETVRNSSWELFEDMNRYNVFAGPMRRRLLSAMRGVDRKARR